jgi:hypothetical protein
VGAFLSGQRECAGLFNPAAAVGDPPAEDQQRQREDKAPENWDGEIQDQAEDEKQQPEHFFLHGSCAFHCRGFGRRNRITKGHSVFCGTRSIIEASATMASERPGASSHAF